MIIYKLDLLQHLKAAGYSSYRLKKEKILADSTLQKLRNGDTNITVANLNIICTLLQCQPGDILGWEPDRAEQSAAEAADGPPDMEGDAGLCGS